jgi:high affinity Mn2+ porin
MKKLLSGVLTLFLVIFLTAPLALSQPSESELLMKMLLKKGIITQQEYEEIMSEIHGKESVSEKMQQIEERTSQLEEKQAEIEEISKKLDERLYGKKNVIGSKEPADPYQFMGEEIENEEGRQFTPRDVLDDISVGGGITLVYQGTSGNDDNLNARDDTNDAMYSADVEVSAPISEHGEAYMLMEAGDGSAVTDEIQNFYGTNDAVVDNENSLDVTEAWYEHKWLDDRLIFTAGKIDLTNYFDENAVANDEHTQFLSTGLVNNIAVQFTDNTGGARMKYIINDLIDVGIGYNYGDDDWEDVFEDPFLIGEIALRPKFGEGERLGNYRFYYWTNRTEHTNWDRLARGIKSGRFTADDIPDFPPDAPTEDSLIGYGYGLSFDQQVSDTVTLFTRFGYQKQEAFPFDLAWSLGFDVKGSLWGRENDVLGVAYAMAYTSNDYEDTLKAYGQNIGIVNPRNNVTDFRTLEDGDETFFEAYYSFAINDSLAISPDVQLVTNSWGLDKNDSALILGLRAQVWF